MFARGGIDHASRPLYAVSLRSPPGRQVEMGKQPDEGLMEEAERWVRDAVD